MKMRYRRVGDVLTDDADVVVRGGDLVPDLLRQDARRNFASRASTSTRPGGIPGTSA